MLSLPGGDTLALDFSPGSPQAPWVVFLHGLGSTRQGEKATFLHEELLRRNVSIARFDFRGHGDSSGTLARLTLTRLLEDLRSVLAFLRGKTGQSAPAVLVGSSMGALVAAWHAALHSETVAGQVLLAPALRIVERLLASLGETGRRQWQRAGVHRFTGYWLDFDLGWELVEDSSQYPHELLVQRTCVPTWILHGDGDESVPVELSREFARSVTGASLVYQEIPGAGHRLTEHRDRILDTVLRCLRKVAPRNH